MDADLKTCCAGVTLSKGHIQELSTRMIDELSMCNTVTLIQIAICERIPDCRLIIVLWAC